MKFVAKFRFYSPFNALLIHIQKSGAKFVAPPHHWISEYHRRIKAEEQPLLMLQPMGPIMSVFDVSGTEPEKDAPPLPFEVEAPFDIKRGYIGDEFATTIESAKRDGASVAERKDGSLSAGSMGHVPRGHSYKAIRQRQQTDTPE